MIKAATPATLNLITLSSCAWILHALQVLREDPLSRRVLQRNGQLTPRSIRFEQPKELPPGIGRPVGLEIGGCAAELQLRTERAIQRTGRERAGMGGACDKFPERVEVFGGRALRMVLMRRAGMHVRRNPDDVA